MFGEEAAWMLIPPSVTDGPDLDAPIREMGPPQDEFPARKGKRIAWVVLSIVGFLGVIAGLVDGIVSGDEGRAGLGKDRPSRRLVFHPGG